MWIPSDPNGYDERYKTNPLCLFCNERGVDIAIKKIHYNILSEDDPYFEMLTYN